MDEREQRASKMPDAYDAQLASLHGLPDVVKTAPSTMRVMPPLGIGGSNLFVIQTYRQAQVGDTCFLEVVLGQTAQVVRLVLPPAVTAVMARQRDALSTRSRSKAGKAVAADLKARGIAPGFTRGRKKKR